MRIVEYTNKEFDKLKPYWLKLEKGNDMTAFQLYAWYENINSLYRKEHIKNLFRKWVYLVVLDDNESPILIAPIQVLKVGLGYKGYGLKRGFYFIGRQGFSDYLNFIYDEFSGEALELVISFLKKQYKMNYFCFEQMIEATGSYQFIQHNYASDKIAMNYAALKIPDDFEEYRMSLSKSMRQNIRTAINRANRNDIVLTHSLVYELPEETQQILLDMREKRLPKKRKQSYKKASFLGCIYNKGNRIIKALFSARHDVMKQCCNPWAFLVYHNDKIVGFYWGIRNDYKKELYVILAGVDEEYEWYSPAISQFYLFLQEYCNSERDDISVFDFTRGGEKYKTDIGCADKPTSGIVFSLK